MKKAKVTKKPKTRELEVYGDFVNRLTGEAIMSLGRGTSMRDIVGGIVLAAAKWRQDWEAIGGDE